jgi:tellurite resistance protein TehA-like permease
VNVSPAFGVLGFLSAVLTIVVAGLAVYALVLTIVFLRLRIAELKRTARPKDDRQR